jgi:drug/metabolite transporter (DMT)-like permease
VIDRRTPLLGSLTVVIAAGLFATLGVLSRTTYDLGLTPLGFVTWRSGVAAIAMVALVAITLRRGGRLVGWRSLTLTDRASLAVAALAGASLDITMFFAFARVSVAIVLLCFYLFPAMVAGASAVLGWERLDRARGIALVIALAGMVAVVIGGPESSGGAGIDPLGVLLAIGSAVSQAVFVLVSRRGFRQMPTEQAMSVVLTTSSVLAIVLALAGGGAAALTLPLQSPSLLAIVIFGGLFGAGIPSFLFLAGIRWIGGVKAGVLMLAQAPVGVALAALFLHEAIGPIQVVGGAAILLGALIIQRAPSAPSAPSAPMEAGALP